MSKNVPGVLVIMLFISGSFYLTQHASATESAMSTITLPSRIRVGQASSPEKTSRRSIHTTSDIHFIIKATDAAGNTAVSTDLTFMTLPENPDTLPMIISGVMAHNISRNGATASWSTNELATSFVARGTTISYGSSIQLNTNRSRHGISISRLPCDTLIHFRVKSTDTCANTTLSSDYVFRTQAVRKVLHRVSSGVTSLRFGLH